MGRSHWLDEESPTNRVVVLSEDAVYSAHPSKKQMPAISAALEEGQHVASVVKDDVTAVPIGAISMVEYDRTGDDIEIEYALGREKKTESIWFSSAEQRDDFAAQLAERLTDFTSETKVYGPVRAAVGPIGFGAVVAFFTWVLHGAAVALAGGADVDVSGRRAGLKRLVMGIVELIGPTGVLVVGGLLLALTVAVLVMRIKEPPIMVKMKRAR